MIVLTTTEKLMQHRTLRIYHPLAPTFGKPEGQKLLVGSLTCHVVSMTTWQILHLIAAFARKYCRTDLAKKTWPTPVASQQPFPAALTPNSLTWNGPRSGPCVPSTPTRILHMTNRVPDRPVTICQACCWVLLEEQEAKPIPSLPCGSNYLAVVTTLAVVMWPFC
jgi:hypothetical protein